ASAAYVVPIDVVRINAGERRISTVVDDPTGTGGRIGFPVVDSDAAAAVGPEYPRDVDPMLHDSVNNEAAQRIRWQPRDPAGLITESAKCHRDIRFGTGDLDFELGGALERHPDGGRQPQHRFADRHQVQTRAA